MNQPVAKIDHLLGIDQFFGWFHTPQMVYCFADDTKLPLYGAPGFQISLLHRKSWGIAHKFFH